MLTTDIKARKVALRRTMLNHPTCEQHRLAALPEVTLVSWYHQYPRLQHRLIAVYLALPSELGLDPFIEMALKQGLSLVAPRGEADSEAPLYPLPYIQGVETGPFGTREPQLVPNLNAVQPAEVGLWIIPGLAFDEQGYRLGRGGGWYDRVLSRAAPDAVKIGVCFEHQLVRDVPHEPHDIPLDFVIAGGRTIETRQFRSPSSHVSTDAQ